jgi:hypothetical protein
MSEILKREVTQDLIAQLAGTINDRLTESIKHIQAVNDDIHVLSVNAKIQAARAGDHGRGFSVVADMVRNMVHRTQTITDQLQESVRSTVGELTKINSFLGTKVRGDRLSQVAANMIDVVDRNLYERSCDVRWWATEDALVQLLQEPSPQNAERACRRLGIILDSYTVYLDLVLCDLQGRILANGRPDQYPSIGSSVADSQWFLTAKRTSNGTEYGFEGVHRNSLVASKSVLVYSCGVRQYGDAQGNLIGVLGIIFNWAGLGDVVVENAEDLLSVETEHKLHGHLFYPDGTIIASRGSRSLLVKLRQSTMDQIRGRERGTILPETDVGERLVAGFAASKGFETYKTGWYAIVQEERV